MSATVIGPAVGRSSAVRHATFRPSTARTSAVRRPALGGASVQHSGRPHRGGAGAARGAELHFTARGRAVVALLAVVAVAAAFFLGARASAADEATPTVERYVVQSGETLWAIAESSRGAGESVAEQVRELVRVNGLSGSQVMAGQEIVVPRG
jgi:nucleoid-associated protein YgaU